MLTRIALLFSVVWLTRLTQPWLQIAGRGFSGRDLVLLAGGLFLLAKSVLEIHRSLEGPPVEAHHRRLRVGFAAVVAQIALIDIVFSLDSVFTAIGLVRELLVMVAAIVVAILVMMLVSRSIGAFITRHPTIKVLALSFLLLIGVALVGVELINMRLRPRVAERGTEQPQSGERNGERPPP